MAKYELMSIWKLPPFPGQKIVVKSSGKEGFIIGSVDSVYYRSWAELDDSHLNDMNIMTKINGREVSVRLRDLIPVGIVEDAQYTLNFNNGAIVRGTLEEVGEKAKQLIIVDDVKLGKVYAYDQEWRNYYYKYNIDKITKLATLLKGISELQGEMLAEMQNIISATGGKTRSEAKLPYPVLPNLTTVTPPRGHVEGTDYLQAFIDDVTEIDAPF